MMASRNKGMMGTASRKLDDYITMQDIPAGLSALYLFAGLYQFGGISSITFEWINYSITMEHAVWVAVAAYAVAFMSSRTKQFENYEGWEQFLILLGPGAILGQHYVTAVNDLLVNIGDPLGYQIAFVVTVASWGVAVQ